MTHSPSTATRPFGIPGMDIAAGDHLCAFFSGTAERDELIVSFLKAGLDEGAKCLAMLDEMAPSALLEQVGTDADQLQISESPAVYGQALAHPDAVLRCLEGTVIAAIAGGFPFVRIGSEMPRSVTGAGEGLLDYEHKVNDYLPPTGQVALCMYDVDHLDGAGILAMLSAHPKVVMAGRVIINPYFTFPENRPCEGSGLLEGSARFGAAAPEPAENSGASAV